MNFLRGMAKEKLQKVVLVAIVAMIGTGVAGNLYVARQFSDWSTSRQRITDLKRQIDEAEQTKREAVRNQQIHAQLTAFVEAQQTTMLSGDPFSWVVRQVSLFADQHPVRVLAMRPAGKSQHELKSRFEVFSVQIQVEGSYDQLGVFVRDFENQFATAEIRMLEMGPVDVSRPERRATIDLAFLVRPENGPNKAGADSIEGKKAS